MKNSEAPMLKFHNPLLRVLNIKPEISVAASSVLAERQRIAGVEFPASVVELLSLEGGAQFLHRYAEDQELPLKELGEDIVKVWQDTAGTPPRVCERYMRISTENQGVVAFYVKLDGSQDPPVFDNDDTWEQEYEAAAFPYNSLSSTFTTFVLDQVAYGRFWNADFLLSAKDAWPQDDVMQKLQRRLVVGPESENAIRRTLRLLDPKGAIYIRQENGEQPKAKWEILTDSESSATALITTVWDCGVLRETLQCEKAGSVGDRLLKRLRSDR